MRTEVAIVGAGPAGGQAARLLAGQGLEVTVLEMRRRVGDPVQCGEAISEAALEENALPPGGWVRSTVKGVAVHVQGVGPARLMAPGYCIDRGAFDRSLVERAMSAGANLQTSCHVSKVLPHGEGVRLETSKGDLEAEHVIAADGPGSPAARSLGLIEGWHCNVGLQYKFPAEAVDVDSDWLHLFLMERYGGGYAWIFPRGSEVSVGVDVGHSPRAYLSALCRDWGLGIESRSETNGGRIPDRVRLRRLGAGNVLVAGDAAGATNPIFGGGIHSALTTGRLAALAILEAREDGAEMAAPRYEKTARASPFFHPVLSKVAHLLATTTDEELALAVRVYRRRQDIGGLLRLLPILLRRPRLLQKTVRLPWLREALEITARYGW